MNQLATEITKSFYPDLIEKGGLVPALQLALSKITSNLEVQESEIDFFPIYAEVESDKRCSQIYIASEQRMFIGGFWESGIQLGSIHTDSLSELAEVLCKWLETSSNLTELSKNFKCVEPDEIAKYFEAGREVEWRWKHLQNYVPQSFPDLIPFLDEASQNTILNKLFPFTSMSEFHFSRCTGNPFSEDCPFVIPLENNHYQVVDSKGKYIGEGNAEEAIELVIKNLPDNVGAAVRGTAEDLKIYLNGHSKSEI